MKASSEKRENLLLLIVGPTIWAIHFLLSYIVAAIYCAKTEAGANLAPVQTVVGVLTVLALAGICIVAVAGLRRHRTGDTRLPHDGDRPTARHQFIGFASLLLTGLSAVAIIYVALAAVFIGSCH